MSKLRGIIDWFLGRRTSRLDEALARALYRGLRHDEALELTDPRKWKGFRGE